MKSYKKTFKFLGKLESKIYKLIGNFPIDPSDFEDLVKPEYMLLRELL